MDKFYKNFSRVIGAAVSGGGDLIAQDKVLNRMFWNTSDRELEEWLQRVQLYSRDGGVESPYYQRDLRKWFMDLHYYTDMPADPYRYKKQWDPNAVCVRPQDLKRGLHERWS